MTEIQIELVPQKREDGFPQWGVSIDGKLAGRVRLDVPHSRFVVEIDTAFGYGKEVARAVGELPVGVGVEGIEGAIRRGYAEHLKVLKRLKVVERESYPKVISTPMGGKPKR
ncbi:hypothetical protein ACFYN0_26930 [Streptomyces sp. NPDC006704]|uniref:hypothetical protein n=1 Tax=Streptomyces sp. NPDC006704 TaxID=3364760 RepID=UPI00368859C1